MALGTRVEAALGVLLQRRNRTHLYREMTSGLGFGVTVTTYPIISGVARLGPVTATELSAQVGLDRTVISRHATQLERGGLLRRQVDVADPRRSLLILTPEGESAVAAMRARLVGTFDRQLATWPAAEAHSFVDGLERFVREQQAGH